MPTASRFAPMLLLAAACGGSTLAESLHGGDAGHDAGRTVADTGSHPAVDASRDAPRDSVDDAARDAPGDAPLAPADGPFACGVTTCTATQFCLVPCVDVAQGPPVCTPGTACAGVATQVGTCDGGVTCREGPAPPEPSCTDTPPCEVSNFCQVQGRTYTETGCA